MIHSRQKRRTLFSQLDAFAFSLEKPSAQCGFELLDVVTDGALRDQQLLTSQPKA